MSAVQAQNSNSERQREIYDYYYTNHMICSQLSNELETNNESAVAMDQVIRWRLSGDLVYSAAPVVQGRQPACMTLPVASQINHWNPWFFQLL